MQQIKFITYRRVINILTKLENVFSLLWNNSILKNEKLQYIFLLSVTIFNTKNGKVAINMFLKNKFYVVK